MKKPSSLLAKIASLFFLLGTVPSSINATTIRVPADFPTIQAAIDAAEFGDTVLVSAGVFVEHLQMKNGVSLVGVGTGLTVLRRNGCEDAPLIECIDCNARTVIRDFTIDGAPGNDCSTGEPVGIRCVNSCVQVMNNEIINNYSLGYADNFFVLFSGNGLVIEGGAPVIAHNDIRNNRTWRFGGGIWIINSDAIITHNIIRENRVFNWGPDVRGAGIGIESGSPFISNNVFYRNHIKGNAPDPKGGGIFAWPAATQAYIGNNIFISNFPNALEGSFQNVVYNAFFDNSADMSQLGAGNLFQDPQVQDTAAADFHLKKCSPLIDAGDPSLSYALEPVPNGKRLNIGGFGNTPEATASSKPDLGLDVVACYGTPVALDAGAEFSTYHWQNGSSGRVLSVTSPGTYAVTATHANGCSGSDTVKVSFVLQASASVHIEADRGSICPGEEITFTADARFAGSSPQFSWQVNGAPTGSSGSTFSTPSLQDIDVVTCRLASSEGCVTNNPVFSNAITVHVNSGAPYYHAFQNFDDDVGRVNTFSNLFGGNSGVLYGNSATILDIGYETTATRSGYGRSLKIEYGPLFSWSMYLESFERGWYDQETSLDLTSLFPDFEAPEFRNRQVDSIVFFCKLESEDSLSLKLELHDADDRVSFQVFDIPPSGQWQRISVALETLPGCFDPAKAKFMGLVLADFPAPGVSSNILEKGTLYLDDFYLVEKRFAKPNPGSGPELLAYLNEVSFRHFWTAVDPGSKFALDRHIWKDLISVDAIGFQLSAYVIAHQQGWVDPAKIEARVQEILYNLLYRCQHAENTLELVNSPLKYATIKGNWAQFLDINTLERKSLTTPYSLNTNALLLPGVITAGQYFSWNDSIQSMADALYRMTDWNFLYSPNDGGMFVEWTPEHGFPEYTAGWFSEGLDLAFLLAVSSPDPTHRLPVNPFFETSYRKPFSPEGGYVYSASGSNPTYYALQMYAPYPESADRYNNARQALLKDLETCRETYAALGYDARIFGTAPCEGPDTAGVFITPENDSVLVSNYHSYGYCPRLDQGNGQNGTVAVYGSGAVLPFVPDEAAACLDYYYNELDPFFQATYRYSFWSPVFGFPDAFHLNPDASYDPLINGLNYRGPWLSVPRFGINLGPMLINGHNYLSSLSGVTSIRELFSSHPAILQNLADFSSIPATDTVMVKAHIEATATSVCAGEPVTFLLEPEHQGNNPVCEWLVNGNLEQSGSFFVFTLDEPFNGDQVQCRLFSSEPCLDAEPAYSNTLTIQVNALPEPTIQGDASFCEGETAVLDAGPGYAIYRWSNGATSRVVEVTQQGSYSVTVTDENGCRGSDAMAVEELAAPQPAITGPSSICEGEAATLDAGAGYTTYHWSDGTTNRITQAGTPGSYHVTVTNGNGCTGSASWQLEVIPLATATIQISPLDTAICEGETVGLTAAFSNGGASPVFEWEVNGQPAGENSLELTFTPAQAENLIEVFLTSSLPCVANNPTASEVATVALNPLPAVDLIPADTTLYIGDTLQLMGIPPGGMFSGSFMQDSFFLPEATGSFTLTYSYTDENGCSDSVSIDYMVIVFTNAEIPPPSKSITVFPNPSGGHLNLNFTGDWQTVELSVLDAQGRITSPTQKVEIPPDGILAMDWPDMPPGVFFVRVKEEYRVLYAKVVITE